MATSSKSPVAKAAAKKAATPSKAAPAAKATPVKKPAAKAKPAAKPEAKKAPSKPAPKKPAAKKEPSHAKEATAVTSEIDKFAEQVELFPVPATASAAVPAPAVSEAARVEEVKAHALPSSSSKLVTGDIHQRESRPKPASFNPKSKPNFNKGKKPFQKPGAQPNVRGAGQHSKSGNDHRSSLTRRILGDNPNPPVATSILDDRYKDVVIPGVGAPVEQFASEALRVIKHASPEEIDRIATTVSNNVVNQYGAEAGKLATVVANKIAEDVGGPEDHSVLGAVTDYMERSRMEGLPTDEAAKRSLHNALNRLMTNQNHALNTPAKRKDNGMLDLTALFKR